MPVMGEARKLANFYHTTVHGVGCAWAPPSHLFVIQCNFIFEWFVLKSVWFQNPVVSCLEKAVKRVKVTGEMSLNSHICKNAVVKKKYGNNIILTFPIKYLMENLMRIILSFIKYSNSKNKDKS